MSIAAYALLQGCLICFCLIHVPQLFFESMPSVSPRVTDCWWRLNVTSDSCSHSLSRCLLRPVWTIIYTSQGFMQTNITYEIACHLHSCNQSVDNKRRGLAGSILEACATLDVFIWKDSCCYSLVSKVILISLLLLLWNLYFVTENVQT